MVKSQSIASAVQLPTWVTPRHPASLASKQHGMSPMNISLPSSQALTGVMAGTHPLKAQDKVMFRADRQAIDADRQRAIPDDEAAGAVGQITNLNIGAPAWSLPVPENQVR